MCVVSAKFIFSVKTLLKVFKRKLKHHDRHNAFRWEFETTQLPWENCLRTSYLILDGPVEGHALTPRELSLKRRMFLTGKYRPCLNIKVYLAERLA